MAEGNGSFNIDVHNRVLQFTSKDMITVLLILVAGLGGYFVATLLTQNQLEARQTLKDLSKELHEQTEGLYRKVDEQSTLFDARFSAISHKLNMLNYNIHKGEEEQLPLDVALPQTR
jgi:hypothetical protein